MKPSVNKFHNEERYEIANDQMLVTDLVFMCLGPKIGSGDTRDVFEFGLNDDWVIKVEEGNTHNNVLEFELWHDAKLSNDGLKDWLAPCRALSNCGKFLLMDKTTPVLRYPEKMPRCLNDTHTANFGMIGDKFVCHDYANMRLLSDPQRMREKKTKWRELRT